MENYYYTNNKHLLLHFLFGLIVESGVEEQGLLDKGSFIQPPDEQVLGPLDTINVEVPQMESGQHQTEPPRHC